MSWKQTFVRWYYGEFVNEPNGEVIRFGIERPYSASRWRWAVKLLQKCFKF